MCCHIQTAKLYVDFYAIRGPDTLAGSNPAGIAYDINT